MVLVRAHSLRAAMACGTLTRQMKAYHLLLQDSGLDTRQTSCRVEAGAYGNPRGDG
jgi:hypothetical protein